MKTIEDIVEEIEDDLDIVESDINRTLLRLHIETVFTMGKLAQVKEDRDKS